MTTVVAMTIGFALVELFKPYKVGTIALSGTAAADEAAGISFKESILGIIPENFIKAFLDANTMQIIFLAIFVGVAVTAVGSKAKPIQDIINAGNELFLRMTNGLISFMPLLIFCIVSKAILGGGNGTGMGKPIIAAIGVYLLTIVCMVVFYHLILWIIGKLKPFTFTKKYLPYILQVVGSGSSCFRPVLLLSWDLP